MRPLYIILTFCLSALLVDSTQAQNNSENLIEIPEPPSLPEPILSGEVIEPEITIVDRQNERLVEYRYAGRLIAIKIIPLDSDLPAYYLIDSNNDGKLDTHRNEFDNILMNSWVLFTW